MVSQRAPPLKLVHKIERAILNAGMALGTFLDIEGAFDNVAFHAIEKALNKKCSSPNTNNWIMSMIKSRSATVELHGNKKTISIVRGCPQGGILSLFFGTLWSIASSTIPRTEFHVTFRDLPTTCHL